MFDRDIVLEAMSQLCNAKVISVSAWQKKNPGKPVPQNAMLTLQNFITAVLEADESSEESHSHFIRITKIITEADGTTHTETTTEEVLEKPEAAGGDELETPTESEEASTEAPEQCTTPSAFEQQQQQDTPRPQPKPITKEFLLDVKDFFDPRYDYDFTKQKDSKPFYRGGEVYERPCGWYRIALRVLGKYQDGDGWLGQTGRGATSVQGEWPVSYHGTSKQGAEGIISGNFKAGSGQKYGRGVYSTPYIKEALWYCKAFKSEKNGKKYKVMLQNRINPEVRQKHNRGKYWLVPVPKGTSDEEEQKIVEAAIRPYGLLIKAV